ncbi:MAG TPA: hypothetical protein DEA80_14505 [Afipia sp.]|nr:hypothetical protein [Afipia sp.]OUX62352.1 MAG: hypothetical protein CBB64_04395 [Afipia sp. TMED4]HBF53308.1 hypothetical protein [Afipia sp.]HBR46112.1 hypothetical protein [Afipia sp.]HCX19039.1 hypothetical protein [Afipia sp.]|tara:strand:+ start:242 stop:1156 length:915 start_codon:yes stop_codon:yes gene_type:complete
MSDTHSIAPEMTPSETAFFESGGTTEIPASESADREGGDATAKTEQGSGGETNKDGNDKDGLKVVPLAALHEERSRRKRTEENARKIETELAELRGKFSIIEKLQGGNQEQQAEVTPETDIFGFAKKTGETVAELQKRLDAQDAQNKDSQERGRVVTNYQTDAARFTQANPDFGDAYKHLLQSRANELRALGYEDPVELHEALVNEELAIAQLSFKNNKSPAETIYALAQQRGYKKADPNAKTGAASKLETIERGQNANKSLSNTGGGSGDADMTAAMLLKMPNDEFEAWCVKHPAKAKAIFGG